MVLNRRIATELSAALSSVWTPSFCKRHGVAWRNNQWRREVSRVRVCGGGGGGGGGVK